MLQLVGEKCGMTRVFNEDGVATSVTVVRVDSHQVTQVKTLENDGYTAVQLSSGNKKVSRVSKPLLGHYRKAKVEPGVLLFESSTSIDDKYELGQSVGLGVFEGVSKVDVTAVSKGKGFAGTVKRYNFKGGPKTHGQSDRHRAPGSIGAGSSPGRVWKGTKMSGHMGDVKVSQKGLKIIKVDTKKNTIEVKGSVPGANSKTVIVMKENYAS